MNTSFPIDSVVLLGGLLLAVGVAASGLATRSRVPTLLLFVALGMAVADDGLQVVRFDNPALVQNVAVVALVVILFEGGLSTPREAIARVAGPAGLMATAGVAVTAAVVATVCQFVLGLDATTAWMLGAVVASTDAAAVFAVLRDCALPQRVRDLLQVESGANDPIAVLLTVGVVEAWRADPGVGDWLVFGLRQLTGGLVVGLVIGVGARAVLRRLRLPSSSSYAVLALAFGGVAYGVAAMAGASGFLAVYLAGLVLGRKRRLVRTLRTFHEGLAAAAQGVLFLLLGLQVFPSDLPSVAGTSVAAAAVLVLLARPLAVAVLLPWFGFRWPELVLVAWAGLRGAVPIVLATIPLTAGHPDGRLVFDVVFAVVVVSVAVQGPTIPVLARRLGLADERIAGAVAELLPLDSLEADVVELELTGAAAVIGSPLRAVPLPSKARVAAVVRGERTFVPDGDTVLVAGDRLLVVVPPDTKVDDLVDWAG